MIDQAPSPRCRTPILITLAALCGFFSWGYGITPLAAGAVLLWGMATTRRDAWLVMFAYYLGGSRTIPFSSHVFFGADTGGQLGVLLWIGSAAILAGAWIIAPIKPTIRARLLGFGVALVAITVPPVGLIGWMNPWLGASLMVRGFGWISLGGGLLILMLFSCAPSVRSRHTPTVVTLAAVLCITSGLAIKASPLPTAPHEWVGLTTQSGPEPIKMEDQGKRQIELMESVDAALAAGHKYIVLPEQYLGYWSKSWELFIESTLGETLRENGATLFIGATVSLSPQEEYNSLVTFNGTTWGQIHARFAMPVSMWKPWAERSTAVIWIGPGVTQNEAHRPMFSLCYEDLMMWLPLQSFLHQPTMIVSAANVWWAGKAEAIIFIQREHIEAWARIFNVPLIRATNLP